MLHFCSYFKGCFILFILISPILNSQIKLERNVSIYPDSSISFIKTEKQKNILEKIKQRKTTANVKFFILSSIDEMKNSNSLSFAGHEMIYSINEKDKSTEGNRNIWMGKSNGKDANMTTLVFCDNYDVVGSVWLDGKYYRIEPLGDFVHAFIEVDLTKAPKCGQQNEKDNNSVEPLKKIEAIQDVNSSFDVLVAYTTTAKNAAGNIVGLIQLAVAEANQSYINSGVNIRMNLVYTYEVNYPESGSTSTDVYNFKSTTDQYMNDVHTLRNQYKADVCVLIINNATDPGEAHLIQVQQ